MVLLLTAGENHNKFKVGVKLNKKEFQISFFHLTKHTK